MTTMRHKFRAFVMEQMADLADMNNSRFRDKVAVNLDLKTYNAWAQVLEVMREGNNPIDFILQKSEQDSEQYKEWLKIFEENNDTAVPMPEQTWNGIAFMLMLFLKSEEENMPQMEESAQ